MYTLDIWPWLVDGCQLAAMINTDSIGHDYTSLRWCIFNLPFDRESWLSGALHWILYHLRQGLGNIAISNSLVGLLCQCRSPVAFDPKNKALAMNINNSNVLISYRDKYMLVCLASLGPLRQNEAKWYQKFFVISVILKDFCIFLFEVLRCEAQIDCVTPLNSGNLINFLPFSRSLEPFVLRVHFLRFCCTKLTYFLAM